MTEVTMIPIEYIILFAMAIVEVIRKRMPDTYSDLKPFIAFVIAITCNVANAALFGGNMLGAGKEAFIAAGVSLAMFGGGSAVGKLLAPKPATPEVAAPQPVKPVIIDTVKAEQSQASETQG